MDTILDSAGWVYLFLAIPLLAVVALVPFWFRSLSISKRIFATVVYVVSAIALVIGSVVFIVSYGKCLENCYATRDDEIAILASSLLIIFFLGGVFFICKSFKSKQLDCANAADL